MAIRRDFALAGPAAREVGTKMTDSSAQSVLLRPNIPTGGRPILPKARQLGPAMLGLSVVPAIAIIIALVDSRVGFKLLMASLAVTMLVLILALFFRVKALQPGAVRIAAAGGLRFIPPKTHRATLVAVPLSLLLPVIVLLLVRALDLPTQASSSRLMAALPIVFVAVSLGSLAVVAWSMRIPAGLQLAADGLHGVRGGKLINLSWADIVSAAPAGVHGPRLMVMTRSGGAFVIDGNHLGSDPAIVARVIEFYCAHPARRDDLADGNGAIRAVEAAAR